MRGRRYAEKDEAALRVARHVAYLGVTLEHDVDSGEGGAVAVDHATRKGNCLVGAPDRGGECDQNWGEQDPAEQIVHGSQFRGRLPEASSIDGARTVWCRTYIVVNPSPMRWVKVGRRMRRSTFLGAACAAVGVLDSVATAGATGGLDIGDASTPHDVRILLATDSFEQPQQIDQWHFAWNGGTYRGRALRQTLESGRSALIDVLPLDAYLYGVLGKEVSPAWPAEAQAAQAIVARTYALGRLRPKKPYDVVASVSDQRYDGIASETPQGREAVDATSGQVVTFASVPADVAYSACCGGHTADPADVWSGARDLPYLSGVTDPNCAGTPAFRWTVDVPLGTLGALCDSDKLATVEPRDLDLSGRARRIALIGRGTTLVAATEFRSATRIPSTLIASFALDRGSGVLHVAGFGHGHGVGFCQWGARSAAARGMNASDIVQFYFPGTDLGRA